MAALDVNSFATFLLIITLGFSIGVFAFIISRLITPFKHYDRKFERFECANPARGKGKGWFMMQYYCYLIIFLTVEPVMIYMFLFLMADRALFINSIQLFVAVLLMLIPPIIFGLDSAGKLKLWSTSE